jgi:mannose-6-phosphate isomerase-like protein (cupin superfamily)
MADYTVKRFDEMEALYGGFFLRARASLGATAFGMQILQIPADSGALYPAHDHAESGQEEVYVVLAGAATFEVDGELLTVGSDVAVRVGPKSRRHIAPGPDGAKILVLGATPGEPYAAPAWAELGGPLPTAPTVT